MSWVIVERSTGHAVFETWSLRVASAVRRDRFRVVAILDWLQSLNREGGK